MTDDVNDKQPQPRRRRRAPDDAASPPRARRPRTAPIPPASPPDGDDDPGAALERLESLTASTAAPPVADTPSAPPREQRPISPVPRTLRPRPAAAPRAGQMIARIAAPVVFLVAVVVLLSIFVQSGVIGGKATPVATPTPAVTNTKSGGNPKPTNYKLYVVKSGDTLSGIAVKFHVTTSDLQVLNPKLSSSTLVIGTKIKVPKPLP